MQLVTRATSIAAVAVVFISMLMQMAVAVEVTNSPASPALGSSPSSQFVDPGLAGSGLAGSGLAGSGPADASKATTPPPSPNCHILGSRSFSIPFSVDASGAQPVEVHLFVSRGPDDPWKLLDRKKPNVPEKQFQFEADGDGEFWFATRTVDTMGRSHPSGQIESQLKVYVDTTKPQVALQADADADGRVDVTLSIQDATKLKDMQLRYVTDAVKQWVQIDLSQLSADGRLQFHPKNSWKQLSIQLVVIDTPGNQSVVNQLLRRPRLADANTNRLAAAPSRSSTEAMALPYRIGPDDALTAHPVSNPVIKLDRHQPRPVSNVTTAQGYAPQVQSQGNSSLYGFRGAQTPIAPSPAMTYVPPPELAPAPAPPFSGTPYPAPQSTSPLSVGPSQTAGALPQAYPPASQSMATYGSIPSQGSIPTNGMVPQQAAPSQPASLLDRLFGTSPSPSYPVPSNAEQGSPTQSAQPSMLGFGPPSVRGAGVQPRFAGNVDSGLPRPATPDQISNGFGLNSPGQSQPETIPVPGNPEPSPPQRPRPKTAAEAMRPITERSEVSALSQEEVPTPQGEPEPYQSRRATSPPAFPSAPSGDSLSSVTLDSLRGRAPVRYSDSERFSLAYELEAVGAQGVDAIELYGSTDGGRKWELWGLDPDRTSPFDIETKEAGVFGFRIVVISRNGLASPRPLSGESS